MRACVLCLQSPLFDWKGYHSGSSLSFSICEAQIMYIESGLQKKTMRLLPSTLIPIFCIITEMVEAGYIQVVYIPTADMVADGMTTPLPCPAFCRFMDMLGLKSMYLGEGLHTMQVQPGLRCRNTR